MSLHCLGMRPRRDQERSTGVTKVVRSKVEARCLESRLPHSPAEVASAQRFAVGGSEDASIVGGSNATPPNGSFPTKLQLRGRVGGFATSRNCSNLRQTDLCAPIDPHPLHE